MTEVITKVPCTRDKYVPPCRVRSLSQWWGRGKSRICRSRPLSAGYRDDIKRELFRIANQSRCAMYFTGCFKFSCVWHVPIINSLT